MAFTKYELLMAFDTANLVAYVNDYIKQGWQPQGGVMVVEYNNNFRLYQAMVK